MTRTLERRWLHYAFVSSTRDGSGPVVIANLSELGAGSPGRTPHRRAILLVHDGGHGWHSSQFSAEQPHAPWSSFRIPHPFGVSGPFTVSARAGRPAVDLRLRRTSRPCTAQTAGFGDSEFLRWQSEPGVRGEGRMWTAAGEEEVRLVGYHERVRGRWSWPVLGGWVFGFANDPGDADDGAPPAAVVFTFIHPTQPADAANGSVMLWRDGRLLRHFPRRAMRIAVQDLLERDGVTLVPPLASCLGTAAMEQIPRHLVITAETGRDRVVLDFTAVTAARIANPSESGSTPFSVHETLGPCRVEAEVGGRRLAFTTRAVVEFAGGAHHG